MKKAVIALSAALALLFILLLAVDEGGRPSDFSLFFGRFHPLFVHLPIGLLVIAAVLEGIGHLRKWGTWDKTVATLLFAGCLSAVLAAIAGMYLARGGGYDISTLDWHKRLGIVTAVLSGAAFFLKAHFSRPDRPPTQALRRGYVATVVGYVITVAIAGHLGGELTHGDGYLTRYMPDFFRGIGGLPNKDDIGKLRLDNPAEVTTFDAFIRPILDDRCVACHHAGRAKGGLALDTREAIEEGGDDGPVLVAGRAEESELIHRVWLPLQSEDHMPPEGRPQLTVAEAELIRWWIDRGASFEETLTQAEPNALIQTILDEYGLDEIRTGIFALDVPPPDSQDVAALAALGVSVSPLAEDEPFLQVRCLDPYACSGDSLTAALHELAPQIAWLDLGRTNADDVTVAALSELPHVTRLHLEQTAITDYGLQNLSGMEYLEYLNLYGTAVSDSGLQHLTSLDGLRALYLWQTDVTEDGAALLEGALPDLEVNLGLSLELVPETDDDDASTE